MPLTCIFCIIGAISIAGFPLTSGFVTKNLTLGAAELLGYFWIWLLLIFASAGVMEHSGIKIPFFAFFSHDGGHRVKEAPFNMLLAMGIAAFACIFIGVMPSVLYSILPYPVEKNPYTVASVITKTQLLVFSVIAFGVLIRNGWYPKELPSTNLNTDWLIRKPGMAIVRGVVALSAAVARGFSSVATHLLGAMRDTADRHHGPDGILGRTWATGSMTFWMTVMLGAYLILTYMS
jgi:multicomponent Na+:H+ antiporter subunit D